MTKFNAKARWRRGCEGADQSESAGFGDQHLEKYFGGTGNVKCMAKYHERSMPKSSLKTHPRECWSKYFWNSLMSMWLPLMQSFRTPTSLKPSNRLQHKISSSLASPSSSTLNLVSTHMHKVFDETENLFFISNDDITPLVQVIHLIIFHCQFLTMPHQQLTSIARPCHRLS